MAYLETGIFCSTEEYRSSLNQRIHGSDIKEQEIYTMLLKLEAEEREATKLAIRPYEIRTRTSGMAIIKFAFLTPKLEPETEVQEIMRDGLINPVNQTIVVDNVKGLKYKPTEAYLKDYFDDQFGDFLSESYALTTSG